MNGDVTVYNLSSPDTKFPTQWSPSIELMIPGLNHTDATRRTSAWNHWDITLKMLSTIREYSVDVLNRSSFFQARQSSCPQASGFI